MKNVLILGASGMLGSMIVDYFARWKSFRLTGAVRSMSLLEKFQRIYPEANWVHFNYHRATQNRDFETLGQQDWVINCIGITKPLIKDDNSTQIENAVLINCMLPHDLSRYAASLGGRILQIATDCVYSGKEGLYKEDAAHDPVDVYGKTKSIGETWQPNVHHLRCSIIGPEPKDFKFLIEWFRRQERGATVNGFINHNWNGVTTLHFAKICQGIVDNGIGLGHLQHVVPDGSITKAKMLQEFAKAYGRADIVIKDIEAGTVIDRTLATSNPERNSALWRAAGHENIPTVSDMIAELGAYQYRGAIDVSR